jgi:hypothetical protein
MQFFEKKAKVDAHLREESEKLALLQHLQEVSLILVL